MEQYTNALKKYHRFSNYLGVGMLYLKENSLLQEPLTQAHMKSRVLGHWGTVPGLNLVYGGLSALIKEKNIENTLLVTGPGHGAPAIIAGLFIEGTLGEYYKEATLDRAGIGYVLKQFSWPGGFPSHTYPGLPGQIHEGGELGYALGTAFGAAFDKPDLLSVAIVGDGEAETGPLAASWHSNKFLSRENDGLVLPMLHLNRYKISGPTLFSTMSNDEINAYFWGLGYEPWIVDQYELGDEIYSEFLKALAGNYERLHNWKQGAERMPVLILKTMKGWTGPEYFNDKKIEDNNVSHGIPLKNPKSNDSEFEAVRAWLESYNVHELVDETGKPTDEILQLFPEGKQRIGSCEYGDGNPERTELVFPDIQKHEEKFEKRGTAADSSMENIAEYFADVFAVNKEKNHFRLFSPDESESNMLEPVFEQTVRVLNRDLREHDDFYSHDGKIMEILSEHVLQEWMTGYVITGGHGVLISYEAFLGIVTSQIDQYLKYIKQSKQFSWRKPVSSMNYIATSTAWRQDHNGFSHQNPTLINSLLAKGYDSVSVYLPADINTLLATFEDSLGRTDCVNLVISGKRDLPQWLTLSEAKEHVARGISVWDWAGNVRTNFTDPTNDNKHTNAVDVVLASAGDYQTVETLAAAQILRDTIPELKFQYVNVNELTSLGFGDEYNPILTKEDYELYFTKDKPVIFNFHGYPSAIKMLTWGSPIADRLTVLGYSEQGSTTTPFDMQVVNKTSRYHVAIYALLEASKYNPAIKDKAETLIQHFTGLLAKHRRYIVENGEDIPEVREFEFNF